MNICSSTRSRPRNVFWVSTTHVQIAASFLLDEQKKKRAGDGKSSFYKEQCNSEGVWYVTRDEIQAWMKQYRGLVGEKRKKNWRRRKEGRGRKLAYLVCTYYDLPCPAVIILPFFSFSE